MEENVHEWSQRSCNTYTLSVASSDLLIWHAFFGVAGSNNDINVLDWVPVYDKVLQGRAPEVNYTINGNNYNMGYC